MKKIGYIGIIVAIVAVLGMKIYFQLPKSYNLSIAAIMKNEKPYLKEWLEYHLLQGVEHFYLCDNGSTDETKEYLAPYIDKGIITYIDMPGTNKQLVCYDKIVKGYKAQTKWLAFIDIDEYMVPIKAKNMRDFLKEFEDVSEVSLHWMNYGDSGAISRPNGLVTEFFTQHGQKLNHTVKSIVRPKDVIDFSSFGSNHYVKVNGPSVNEQHHPVNFMLSFYPSAKKARINHYIVKSFAEFLYKKKRGHPEGTPINYGYYFLHNENDIKNDSVMERFLPALKRRMKKSPLKDIDVPQSENLPDSFKDFYFSATEASSILNKNINFPMQYDELQRVYKQSYPQYNKN